MRFIHQLSMSVKISFLAILGTALFGFAVVTSALSIVEKSMETQTFKSLDSTINYVHRLLETHGEHYVIKDDKLMIGDFVLSDNNDFVDELVRLNGRGAITFFKGDVRVATNALKEDGSRAVGTALAQGEAYDAVFKEKKKYRGAAVVAGKAYLGAYDPIFNAQGQLIGMLFAGLSKEDQHATIAAVTQQVSILSLLIGLVLAGVIYGVIRFQLRPLVQMEEVMECLQKEQVDIVVPAQNRGDEIGRMAKAVQAFKEGIIEKIRLRHEAEEQKKKVELDRRALMVKMADDFEQSVGHIVQVVASAATELQSSAKNLSEMAAKRISKPRLLRLRPKKLRPVCKRLLPRRRSCRRPSGKSIDKSSIQPKLPIRLSKK